MISVYVAEYPVHHACRLFQILAIYQRSIKNPHKVRFSLSVACEKYFRVGHAHVKYESLLCSRRRKLLVSSKIRLPKCRSPRRDLAGPSPFELHHQHPCASFQFPSTNPMKTYIFYFSSFRGIYRSTLQGVFWPEMILVKM